LYLPQPRQRDGANERAYLGYTLRQCRDQPSVRPAICLSRPKIIAFVFIFEPTKSTARASVPGVRVVSPYSRLQKRNGAL